MRQDEDARKLGNWWILHCAMLITGPPPECPHHISCDWWRLISLDDPWQFRELDHGISESQSSAFIWALVSPRPGVKMQLDVLISLEETS